MQPTKNVTLVKPLEDSSMNYEESEDMSFRVYQLEGLVKGFVSKEDLDKSMYKLRKDLEKGLEGSVKKIDLDNLQIHMEEMG